MRLRFLAITPHVGTHRSRPIVVLLNTLPHHLHPIEIGITLYYHAPMAKVVVTFKLEEHIYSKLKQLASDEGRTPSEILREALNAYLEKKTSLALPDFIDFIRKQKAERKSWTVISALVQTRYRVSLTKDQLKALTERS